MYIHREIEAGAVLVCLTGHIVIRYVRSHPAIQALTSVTNCALYCIILNSDTTLALYMYAPVDVVQYGCVVSLGMAT
jgi:hypothetical protein